MAITPAEARELTEAEMQLVQQYEKDIDAQIGREFDGGRIIFQFPPAKFNPPPRVIQTLLEKYKMSGWETMYTGIGPHSPAQIAFVSVAAPH